MPRDLLLEIGAEEIPASFIQPALADLARVLTAAMDDAGLGHGAVRAFGTPRRLALYVADVADRTADATRDELGPSVATAFDEGGRPTVAAQKFAAARGLSVEQLQRAGTPKGERLVARVLTPGKAAEALLAPALHAAVHGIHWPKSMRWGDVEQLFARPVQWLVALLGDEVLPVVLGDVRSGRTTRGHRFLAPAAIELRTPADYETALERAHVVADFAKRRALLVERVQARAQAVGATVREDESLIDQVTNLVELPNPVVGSFEARHLDLPPEVLVQEMKSHQRYFSLTNAAGEILPRFIAVSNTPVRDEALSVRGYERVLKARLADGRFFFDEDRKTRLADRVPTLSRVVWVGPLGSYAEKVDRVRRLALHLAKVSGRGDAAVLERAATLAKADLVTGMVGEFPELQGVMGREYARHDGEPAAVALAIYEHYLPRTATDALPTRDEGALLGVADRLDSIGGIFAMGKGPTASADPYALRRACLGVINIVLERGLRFGIGDAVDHALELLAPRTAGLARKAGEPPLRDVVLRFFRERLLNLWTRDARADVVEAVLSAGFDDLVGAHKRLIALAAQVGAADFAPLATAFRRVANIVEKQGRDVAAGATQPERFTEGPERDLHAAYLTVRGRVTDAVAADDFARALAEISSLKPTVDRFFDTVMVMVEDRALRENRVRLLTEIGSLFGLVADFAKIRTEA